MNVSITIFDGKDFTLAGPLGCNMCAGILSETLLEKLSQDGITIPDEVVQNRISGYYVQLENDYLLLQNPRGKRITTVFRGNGPRFYNPNGTISFDDFLLTVAQENGAKVVAQPVIDVILPKTKSDAVQLIYGEGNEFEADLVVGAFGVNTAFAEKIRALNFGYQPPKVLRGMQTELLLGKEHIQQDFGDNVIIFRLGLKGIRFAAFTPKSDHITATIVCRTDATRESLSRILLHPAVRRWLPETFQLPRTYCLCHPKIPVTPAKNPFTDRLVIIGDARLSAKVISNKRVN
jgi:flavin-dependent dehydrogenase